MTDIDLMREKASSAIAGALGELVTNWVLVATTITDDGDNAAWCLTQPEQPPWTTMGLLAWAQLMDDQVADE